MTLSMQQKLMHVQACHNERVARSRRHAEAKRQRAARKEKEAKERAQHPKEGSSTLSETPMSSAFSAASASNLAPQSLSPAVSPATTPTNASYQFTNATSPNYSEKSELPPTDQSRPRERDLSSEGRLPRSNSPGPIVAEPPPLAPPIPSSPSEPSYSRAKTGDPSSSPRSRTTTGNSPQIVASQSLGSTAPLNLGSKSPNSNAGLGVGPVGLSVPTSRAEKRRSINPAMSFNMDAANGTFAVEPRLSPLPPSPLRTSFSDLQEEQGGKGPTSPSPTVGNTAFPFPHPAPAPPTMGNVRYDSEPDSLDQHTSQPANNQAQHVTHDRKSEDNENTPRLIAPDLPAMSFSLSDPDFASILNDMDKTSPKDISGNTGPGGSMPKTSVSQSSFITKSPQMDQLASAAASDDNNISSATPTPGGLPKSLSSARLGPPHMLRTRQTSTESTSSIGARFNSESALYTLVELVASAKHANNDKVQVDLMLLANIVSETEDLRDQISGLRSKYTGAKVCRRFVLLINQEVG